MYILHSLRISDKKKIKHYKTQDIRAKQVRTSTMISEKVLGE